MKKLNIITIAAAIFVVGCAQKSHPLLRKYNFGTKIVAVESPMAGEIRTIAVGEPLIVSGKNVLTETVHIKNPVSLISEVERREDPIGNFRIMARTGYFSITHKDDAGYRYAPILPLTIDWFEQGQYSSSLGVNGFYRIDNQDRVVLIWSYPNYEETHAEQSDELSAVATIETISSRDASSLQRELIYTGRSGANLTLLYREFINDMARPAFSQQLQYDISNDPVIGFQGARFRVVEATNTSITYEVMSAMAAPRL